MKIHRSILFLGIFIMILLITACSRTAPMEVTDTLQATDTLTHTPSPVPPTQTLTHTPSPIPNTDTPGPSPTPTNTSPPTNTPTQTPIPPYESLVELFDYDRTQPVDLVVEDEEIEDGVKVQLVKYYGANHQAYQKPLRVPAYLVLPEGDGPFPAILYLHAGMNDKSQYLDEAIFLAKHNVVCLLIDGPISADRFARIDPFDWEKVRDAYIRTVIDVRRGFDLLESLPQVDPDQMAFVGHSYGATWAGVLAGIETRIKAYVIMAGYAQVSKNDTPQVPELDAIRYIGHAAPATYLFQFAEQDAFIDEKEAQLYFDTANEPKTMLWYDTDHFTLQHVSQADRLAWLGEQLGFTLEGLPQQ